LSNVNDREEALDAGNATLFVIVKVPAVLSHEPVDGQLEPLFTVKEELVDVPELVKPSKMKVEPLGIELVVGVIVSVSEFEALCVPVDSATLKVPVAATTAG